MVRLGYLLVLALPFVVVGCASTPSSPTCAGSAAPTVVYRPPLTPVLLVAKEFKRAPNLHFNGVPTPATEYRPYAKVWVQIDSSGTPVDARFPLRDGYESTGNRGVDNAIRKWAMGTRFSPDTCRGRALRAVAVNVYLVPKA